MRHEAIQSDKMDNGKWRMENATSRLCEERSNPENKWIMENGEWKMLPPVFARNEAIQSDKMDNI